MNTIDATHSSPSISIPDARSGRKLTNRFANGVLCFLFMLIIAPCGSQAQSALTDDADGQTGNGPNLLLTPTSNVYLKFKLSSTLPSNTAGSDVARATLKLYLGNVRAPGAVDVYQITSSWSEHTVLSAPPSLGDIVQAGIQVQSGGQRFRESGIDIR